MELVNELAPTPSGLKTRLTYADVIKGTIYIDLNDHQK